MKNQTALVQKNMNWILPGFLILMCSKENPVTNVSPITTLAGNKEFVRSRNDWISDTGFSKVSLSESFQRWVGFENTQGKTYIYYKSFGSWTGYSVVDEVLVDQDSCARIIRTDRQADRNTGKMDTLCRREIATDSSAFYGILTFDKMYKYARDSILTRDTNANRIYLEIFQNGLLKSCTYRPLHCVDDCLFGVSIDSLFFGEIREKK
jgi:hypothetical protein